MLIGRRALLGGIGATTLAPPLRAAAPEIDWAALGQEVRAEMAWAWAEYRHLAWGADQIRPVSGTRQTISSNRMMSASPSPRRSTRCG